MGARLGGVWPGAGGLGSRFQLLPEPHAQKEATPGHLMRVGESRRDLEGEEEDMDENRTDSEAESRTGTEKGLRPRASLLPPPATEGHACISPHPAQPSASEPGQA